MLDEDRWIICKDDTNLTKDELKTVSKLKPDYKQYKTLWLQQRMYSNITQVMTTDEFREYMFKLEKLQYEEHQ
jgi:uncharacterized protein YcbK (DUF882 family)